MPAEDVYKRQVYKEAQAKQAVENFFTVENLTALREIALRRCADRVNILTENAVSYTHLDVYKRQVQ